MSKDDAAKDLTTVRADLEYLKAVGGRKSSSNSSTLEDPAGACRWPTQLVQKHGGAAGGKDMWILPSALILSSSTVSLVPGIPLVGAAAQSVETCGTMSRRDSSQIGLYGIISCVDLFPVLHWLSRRASLELRAGLPRGAPERFQS